MRNIPASVVFGDYQRPPGDNVPGAAELEAGSDLSASHRDTDRERSPTANRDVNFYTPLNAGAAREQCLNDVCGACINRARLSLNAGAWQIRVYGGWT